MTALIDIKETASVKASKRHNSCHQSKYRSPFRKLPLSKNTTPESKELQLERINCDRQEINQGCCSHFSLVKQANVSMLASLRRNYTLRGLSTQKNSSDCKWISIEQKFSKDRDFSVSCSDAITSENKTLDNEEVSLEHFSLSVPRTCPINIRSSRRTIAPLKFGSSNLHFDNSDEETISYGSSDTHSGNTCKNSKRKYRIRFHSYVKVVEIPDRHAYTLKQRGRLWNSNQAIRENAKRNKLEYEWEGWEWQNVLEEDEFCHVKGQLVHPAHAF